ncbi:MAG: peptide chain release factor N(5)-glutamine methyltransferase [Gammaproteobacteria bacterium]|nr:peptide chain release factor N(5)-glutamine methyltransferase [Gammaproteobacteria bacterium]
MTRVTEILKTKEIPDSSTPRLDLELLLAEALHEPRSFLYANSEYELDAEQEKIFQALYQRRLQGEPIAYILGKREFWSLELMVNNKVLIPRPETELLVEIILDKLRYERADVADLGSGSGAIALALAHERPLWDVVSVDISADALWVARQNAMKLQIQNIEFCCGDWCNGLPDKLFDAIVSNPPYIAKHDPHLQEGDVRHEPFIALESGDGLDAIRKIIVQAKDKLKVGGLLVLEHGHDQSDDVQKLLQKGGYKEIIPYKDFAGIYRAVMAKR